MSNGPKFSGLKLWRGLRHYAGCGAFLVGLAGAPQAFAAPVCHGGAKPMARLELIFGLGERPRHRVSDKAFMEFLGTEVTPRFPDGLSLFAGYGQWRHSNGTLIKETSRLLVIFYAEGAASDAKIEAIREAYKKRFHQQSVLRADGASCVSF